MRVLITGGFGGLGMTITQTFIDGGHDVRVLDLDTPANRARFQEFGGRATVHWGTIGDTSAISAALEGMDALVHLAAIIPPLSEENPELTRKVNIEGTENVLKAVKAAGRPIRLLVTSSVSVFGPTPDAKAPLHPDRNPMNPVDHYTRSKAECEKMTKDSGLDHVIVRIAAAPHLDLDPGKMKAMFMFPWDSRIEFVHMKDVATAMLHAIERFEGVKNRVYILAGGKSQQFLYHEFLGRTLGAIGLPCPPAQKFSKNPSYLDWYDTSDAQAALEYQKHTIDDFAAELAAKLPGWQRALMKGFIGPVFGKLIVRFL